MAAPIIVVIAHKLGAAEAQARVSQGIDKARSDFSGVFERVDLVWRGMNGQAEVVALKQTVRAAIDVGDDNVRVQVELPWYLAPLQDKIAELVNRRGADILALPAPKPA